MPGGVVAWRYVDSVVGVAVYCIWKSMGFPEGQTWLQLNDADGSRVIAQVDVTGLVPGCWVICCNVIIGLPDPASEPAPASADPSSVPASAEPLSAPPSVPPSGTALEVVIWKTACIVELKSSGPLW